MRSILFNSGHNLFLPPPSEAEKALWRVGAAGDGATLTTLKSLQDCSTSIPGSHLEEASLMAQADPFVDRSRFDFHLKEGSAAIDAGFAFYNLHTHQNETFYKGEGPDIGAVEGDEPIAGPHNPWPEIPGWLREEYPESERRKHKRFIEELGLTGHLNMGD